MKHNIQKDNNGRSAYNTGSGSIAFFINDTTQVIRLPYIVQLKYFVCYKYVYKRMFCYIKLFKFQHSILRSSFGEKKCLSTYDLFMLLKDGCFMIYPGLSVVYGVCFAFMVPYFFSYLYSFFFK